VSRAGWLAVALVAASGASGLVAAAAPAGAQTPPPPTPGPTDTARLGGQFILLGTVTVAKNIKGEHVGDQALRDWLFTPLCPAGACAQIKLARKRAGGTDTLTLDRTAPGKYRGTGLFYVPLKCKGRTYQKGESVPFTIRVQIIGAQIRDDVDTAIEVHATYTNRSRENLTPCVAIPGHDAATYHGHLVVQPSTGGGGV
jgi:hypothetical protein